MKNKIVKNAAKLLIIFSSMFFFLFCFSSFIKHKDSLLKEAEYKFMCTDNLDFEFTLKNDSICSALFTNYEDSIKFRSLKISQLVEIKNKYKISTFTPTEYFAFSTFAIHYYNYCMNYPDMAASEICNKANIVIRKMADFLASAALKNPEQHLSQAFYLAIQLDFRMEHITQKDVHLANKLLSDNLICKDLSKVKTYNIDKHASQINHLCETTKRN